MAKVHPGNVAAAVPAEPAAVKVDQGEPTVLTVWLKSLLFNCDGFTVYDAKGDLAFRVDCYGSPGRRRAEVVLMDVAGTPLLTVRRKRLVGLLAEHWVIYDGDGSTGSKPLLSVRRHVGLRASSSTKKTLAHVTPPASTTPAHAYVVEGSYARRACAVRDAAGGGAVAEVRRKESVGDDVFRLVADPRLGAPLAMGLVIALDQMFPARSA